MLTLSTWSGPRAEQTQRRFDHDAIAFKVALQTQLVVSRQQQTLIAWLGAQSDLPFRVRLFEENRDFPSQLVFDNQPGAAVPQGSIWQHGISQRFDIGGRTLSAVLSPARAEQAQSNGGLPEAAVLLLVMGLALALPFVLPQLASNAIDLFTAAYSLRLAR